MSCGLSDGITVEFPTENIEVRVREADLRAKRRNFMMGKVQLSEAAGKLVANSVPPATYGYVKFDGNRSRRVYRPDDAVTFKEDLDEITYGELILEDPRMVLKRGNVSKSWVSVQFSDAIDHVLNQRHDPHGVVTGVEYVHEEAQADAGPSSFEDIGVPGVVGDIINRWSLNYAEYIFTDDFRTIELQSVMFDEVSPMEALLDLLNMVEMPWWIGLDGTLFIGRDAGFGNVIGKVAGDNGVALSRYSITRDANQTNAVQVQGPFSSSRWIKDYEFEAENDIQVLAEAKFPDIEGDALSMSQNKSVGDPEKLEQIAAARLMNEVMDDTEGSLAINGMASTEIELLGELDIGDVIYIDDGVESECNEDVTTGLFLINSVHHRAGTRKGWNIELKVSRFVNPAAMEMKSVIYNPTEEKQYEDLEAYREGVQEHQRDEFGEILDDATNFFLVPEFEDE